MKRIHSVIGLKKDKLNEYWNLHRRVWPSVLKRIKDSNIQNYSIALYLKENGEMLLVSYFEYVGSDYAADMKKIGDDPETQRWWELTAPLQERVPEARIGEQWHEIPEVFHVD